MIKLLRKRTPRGEFRPPRKLRSFETIPSGDCSFDSAFDRTLASERRIRGVLSPQTENFAPPQADHLGYQSQAHLLSFDFSPLNQGAWCQGKAPNQARHDHACRTNYLILASL